jgi:copper chaperone
MRFLLTILIIAGLLSCQQGNQKQNQSSEPEAMASVVEDTIHIGKMHCEMCVASVEKGVAGLEGVDDVKAILADSVAVVKYNPTETSLEEIHNAIVQRGYTVKETFPDLN